MHLCGKMCIHVDTGEFVSFFSYIFFLFFCIEWCSLIGFLHANFYYRYGSKIEEPNSDATNVQRCPLKNLQRSSLQRLYKSNWLQLKGQYLQEDLKNSSRWKPGCNLQTTLPITTATFLRRPTICSIWMRVFITTNTLLWWCSIIIKASGVRVSRMGLRGLSGVSIEVLLPLILWVLQVLVSLLMAIMCRVRLSRIMLIVIMLLIGDWGLMSSVWMPCSCSCFGLIEKFLKVIMRCFE